MRRISWITLASLILAMSHAAMAQSTYEVAQEMVRETKPKCAFRSGMSYEEYAAWQDSVRIGMRELMGWDEFGPMALKLSEPKFTMLRPDGAQGPLPAVLCIPGSGMTMAQVCDTVDAPYAFARKIVDAGYVAVVVENACAGELRDSALADGAIDYVTPSRLLLELGWHWLGYASLMDYQVLQWMKTQPEIIDARRICVAGFSLGTEPLMVLGVMDPDICCFVYNDFLCQTQERAEVMTEGGDGRARPFPNSIRHLVPRWWQWFNFPDVVASLAPRPILLTEGGMDRDFELVREAYAVAGAPENASLHHYPKFANPESRVRLEEMPRGIDRDEFFRLANVDPPSHCFKTELLIPWLRSVFGQNKETGCP
ncbi:MAG: alpha/beta hydrolase family protein [Bacteroidales bacterium]|nr:alpha/beta hydrolase family protein [Bacteroidales bacterium]